MPMEAAFLNAAGSADFAPTMIIIALLVFAVPLLYQLPGGPQVSTNANVTPQTGMSLVGGTQILPLGTYTFTFQYSNSPDSLTAELMASSPTDSNASVSLVNVTLPAHNADAYEVRFDSPALVKVEVTFTNTTNPSPSFFQYTFRLTQASEPVAVLTRGGLVAGLVLVGASAVLRFRKSRGRV